MYGEGQRKVTMDSPDQIDLQLERLHKLAQKCLRLRAEGEDDPYLRIPVVCEDIIMLASGIRDAICAQARGVSSSFSGD